VWRIHNRRYVANDHGGSLLVSGRFHEGADRNPEAGVWAALYTALTRDVALGELMRHLTPALLPMLNNYRLSKLHVQLARAADLSAPDTLGIPTEQILDDHDLTFSRQLGFAAYSASLEGLFVPSATRLGTNLIIFPDNLSSTSEIQVIDSIVPRLRIGDEQK
jgi:hypothetical protein